jgi:diadenosine tetraphosphate (Ap4A) HIT family hydrolase
MTLKIRLLALVALLANTFNSFGCSFCDPEIIERQAFYEGNLIYALCDYRPIMPGHSLIIPKRHVERFEDLTSEEMAEIMQFIPKMHRAVSQVEGTDDYALLQKNGKSIGQSVPHVHIHYIPKKSSDSGELTTLFRFFWIPRFSSALSEETLRGNVQAVKMALTAD